MKKEIFIEVEEYQTRLALLEDGELVEYYLERPGHEKLAGNIYMGRVENVLPGMQAAFVDIGLEKNAFLHTEDIQLNSAELGEEFSRQLKTGHRALRRGQEILVQVVKEPGGSKGPRISSHVTLPGRYVVLLPTVRYIGVSRKIENETERARLRTLAAACLPEGMGLIMRTASEGMPEEAVMDEVTQLARQWQSIRTRAACSTVPSLIHQDDNLVCRSVRDMLSPEVEAIWVDDGQQYDAAREAVRMLSPGREEVVRRYDERTPLFAKYNLDAKIEKACARRVWLKCGGYLVIDHTEALTVIDVNTGKFVGSHSLDETALKTNCEAAREIARQLRLRDVGGMIVADFIDMTTREDQQTLLACLQEQLKKDRTKTHLVGLTALGLVEMTRKKVHQPLYTLTRCDCPRCQGMGSILSVETLALKTLHDLRVKSAHMTSDAWLMTVSNAVAAQLYTLTSPQGLKVYVLPQSGRLDENALIEPLSDAPPAKARMMTTLEKGK